MARAKRTEQDEIRFAENLARVRAEREREKAERSMRAKARWAKMNESERQAQIDAMQAGRAFSRFEFKKPDYLPDNYPDWFNVLNQAQKNLVRAAWTEIQQEAGLLTQYNPVSEEERVNRHLRNKRLRSKNATYEKWFTENVHKPVAEINDIDVYNELIREGLIRERRTVRIAEAMTEQGWQTTSERRGQWYADFQGRLANMDKQQFETLAMLMYFEGEDQWSELKREAFDQFYSLHVNAQHTLSNALRDYANRQGWIRSKEGEVSMDWKSAERAMHGTGKTSEKTFGAENVNISDVGENSEVESSINWDALLAKGQDFVGRWMATDFGQAALLDPANAGWKDKVMELMSQ